MSINPTSPLDQQSMQSSTDRNHSGSVPTWDAHRNVSVIPFHQDAHAYSYQRTPINVLPNTLPIQGRVDRPSTLYAEQLNPGDEPISVPGDQLDTRSYSKSTLIQLFKDMVSNNMLVHNPLPIQHSHVIADHLTGPLALEPLSASEHEVLQSGSIFPNSRNARPNSSNAIRGNAHGLRLRRSDRPGLPPVLSPSKNVTEFGDGKIGVRALTDPHGSFIDITGLKLGKSKSPVVRSSAPSQVGTDSTSHAGSVASDVWSTAATGAANGDQALSDVASVTWSRRSRSRSPSNAVQPRGLSVHQMSSVMDRTNSASNEAPPGLSGMIAPLNGHVHSPHGHQPLETWTLVEWYYRDPSNTVQGPFSAEQMQEWYTSQYFGTDLLVKATFRSNLGVTADSGPFCKLDLFASSFCKGELVTPFISARYSPARTPLDPASVTMQSPHHPPNPARSPEQLVPHFYEPFVGNSSAVSIPGNVAALGTTVNYSAQMYAPSGSPSMHPGTSTFQATGVYNPASTVGHYTPPAPRGGAWNQHPAFQSRPNVAAASATGGAWGTGLSATAYGSNPSPAMDPKLNNNNNSAVRTEWSSSSGDPVTSEPAVPEPYLPLFGAKAEQSGSFTPSFRPVVDTISNPASRPQSPAVNRSQSAHKSPIKKLVHDLVTPRSPKSNLSSALHSPALDATAAVVSEIALNMSELLVNDSDASWPVQNGSGSQIDAKTPNPTAHDSTVQPEMDVKEPNQASPRSPKMTEGETQPSNKITPSVKEVSLSAWGAKEDAAAAVVWASSFLPAASTDDWSVPSSRPSSSNAASERVAKTSTDSWNGSLVEGTESPWVVKTGHKATAAMKQEASRKLKRDATYQKPIDEKSETVAWQTTLPKSTPSVSSSSVSSAPAPKPAWKPIEGSTKSFAEIQEEESRIEMQRQKRKAEHERSLAEAESADIRAKWTCNSNSGSVWGSVAASAPSKPVSASTLAKKPTVIPPNGTLKRTTASSGVPASEPWIPVRSSTVKSSAATTTSGHSFSSVTARNSTTVPTVPSSSAVVTIHTPAARLNTTNSMHRPTVVPNPKLPVSVVHKKEISEETAKWISSALKKVPGISQLLPSLLAMLTEFHVSSDSVASNTVNTVASLILDMSTVVDSRAFAAEFVKRRRVDLGLLPTWTVSVKKSVASSSSSSTTSTTASLTSTGMKQNTNTSSTGGGKATDVGFQVVSKKKKGGKRN